MVVAMACYLYEFVNPSCFWSCNLSAGMGSTSIKHILRIPFQCDDSSGHSPPATYDWGNTVYENGDGYYGSDSAEAGQYTFTISSKYMRTYSDSVAVDTTITKTLDRGEGKNYTIIGYPSYGDYNWSVSEY